MAGEPRSATITLPTHEVGVLEWGPASGDLVVALHGFPDSAWTWRSVAPLLADAGYRVAAPFLRGYAPSGIPDDGDYSVRALTGDALALHDRLGGDGRAVLLGHDWGAITASAVAADPSSPYARIVTLAVPPLAWLNPRRATIGPWLAATLRQPRHSWYIAFNQVPGLAERTFEGLARRLWRAWSPGYDATEDLAHVLTAVPDRAHAHAAVSYYRSLRPSGMTAALREPRTPLLCLQGDRDAAIDPRYFEVVRPRATAPARAALVPGAGHFLHLERPDVVADHVLRFLREE